MAGNIGLSASGSGFFGRTARQVRESLDRAGLVSPSMHVDLDTLHHRLEQVGEASHEIGWRYAGIASIPADRRRSLDDYRQMADELNAIGARAKPMGFKVLYHNHGYGLTPMEGQIPARVLFDRLDGVFELPRILGHAKRNGVQHFYVEQDLASDPPAQLGASVRYLRGLTLTT